MTPTLQAPPLHRQLAVLLDVVAAVTKDGRSLNELLPAVDAELRPGVQALAFHVLRRFGAATAARRALAPKTPPPRVDALLSSALALLWPDAPPYQDHTLVDQAVVCARRIAPASAGFVNAVLRRFVREREAVVAAASGTPEGRFNHPAWWVDRLRRDWPAHWQVLLEQANLKPPMSLRANVRQSNAPAYRARLQAAGIGADLVDDPLISACALRLHAPCPVQQLPGFDEGACSVQDAAAQRAAPLLLQALAGSAHGARPRVLDACAAPGGKAAHLLEAADLELLALDADAQRLARVHDTLQRLHLHAEVRQGDARQPATWWDGRPFDAILLDAPCSASGIVRRHPDIRWLRRAEDILNLARIQADMLDALWPLLAPGGALLYATCSVFRAEGDDQVDAFLQRQGPAARRIDALGTGPVLPLADNATHPAPALHDGFFYALLHKPVT